MRNLSAVRVLLPLVALLAGCTEPAPTWLDATYVLTSVNGQPLPARVADGAPLALADTFAFFVTPAPNGYHAVRHSYAYQATDGSTQAGTSLQEYRRDGQSVTLLPPCAHDPAALCTGPLTGTLDRLQLTFVFSTNPASTWVYTRVR